MQTSYSVNFKSRVAGLISEACDAPKSIRTYNNPVDVLPYGVVVAKVSANESGCRLPTAAGDDLVGVVVRDAAIRELDSYAALSAVAVMRRGGICALVEEDVTPDDDVFVRFRSDPHVITSTFSGDFVASNKINGTVNGVAIAEVTFDTSNAITIQLVADALNLLDSVASAIVTGANELTITGSVGGTALVSNFTVTLGASQATDLQATVSGPSTGTQLGALRTDADNTGTGAAAVALSKCVFLSNGAAGEAAEVDVNIP